MEFVYLDYDYGYVGSHSYYCDDATEQSPVNFLTLVEKLDVCSKHVVIFTFLKALSVPSETVL